MLSEILNISGKPGLYLLLTGGKGALIEGFVADRGERRRQGYRLKLRTAHKGVATDLRAALGNAHAFQIHTILKGSVGNSGERCGKGNGGKRGVSSENISHCSNSVGDAEARESGAVDVDGDVGEQTDCLGVGGVG